LPSKSFFNTKFANGSIEVSEKRKHRRLGVFQGTFLCFHWILEKMKPKTLKQRAQWLYETLCVFLAIFSILCFTFFSRFMFVPFS
jgi:hypothetical protein